MVQSNDNGENWHFLKLSYPFWGIYFLTKLKGFIFGGPIPGSHMEGFGEIDKTIDQGKTWNLSFTRRAVTRCFFVNEITGFLITGFGRLKEIYKTIVRKQPKKAEKLIEADIKAVKSELNNLKMQE